MSVKAPASGSKTKVVNKKSVSSHTVSLAKAVEYIGGISLDSAYGMVALDKFPVTVLRLGPKRKLIRIPVAALERYLELEPGTLLTD